MTSKEIARPLPVLAELIQHNIDQMAEVSDVATLPYRIAAGYLLAEARSHSWDAFRGWIQRFNIHEATARRWIALAKQDVKEAGKVWKWADAPPPSTNPNAMRNKKWREQPAGKANSERNAANKRRARQDERDDKFARELAEAKALQAMCAELIDAGYRMVAGKYHPDKGTRDDVKFKLLGEAKAFLKQQSRITSK